MLLIEEDDVETLAHLGLTERQAKVYLALLRIGVSKAEAVSKASMIHRQEIYRVVTKLQEMGLVEVKLNKPTMFSAIPIGEALKILVQDKADEFTTILRKTEVLAAKLNRNELETLASVDKPYFNIISGNDCLRKMQNAVESSFRCVEIVTNLKRFSQGFSAHENVLKKALKSGIELKAIVESSSGEAFPKWVNPSLTVSRGFQLKIIPPGSLSTSIVIYDNRVICVCVDLLSDLSRGSQLWSNSKSLVALGQEYFSSLWSQSETVKNC